MRHIVITAHRHIRPLALIVNLHRGQKRCCSEGQFNTNGNLTLTAAILLRIEVVGLYIAQWSEVATDKQLEWSSSDETVATVDQEGLVTILNSGECIITVRKIILFQKVSYQKKALSVLMEKHILMRWRSLYVANIEGNMRN